MPEPKETAKLAASTDPTMKADLSRLHISTESFQNIYKKDWALKRHLAAPLVQEREQFLTHLLRIGMKKVAVQAVATSLLRAVRIMRLREMRRVGRTEVEKAIRELWGHDLTQHSQFRGCKSAYMFRWAVTKWLRFHHKFRSPVRHAVYDKQLNAFTNFLKSRHYTAQTIEGDRCKNLGFLRWLQTRRTSLSRLSAKDLQDFVSSKKHDGWSLATLGSTGRSIKGYIGHLGETFIRHFPIRFSWVQATPNPHGQDAAF